MAFPGVLVHGGAGDLRGDRVASHVQGCVLAARAGADVLRSGGSAVDAVQRAVEVLEDDPQFNAGHGACLTHEGTIELDAAIMDGHTLAAGAVCSLAPFAHPIAIARAVMKAGRHVLYAADGARAFAERAGFTRLAADALVTESARARWNQVRAGVAEPGWAGGTVGAVAWDGAHLAAGTSTGGMVDKASGRVGDSPILGAGTLADDTMGATSATGVGEAIMRVSLARIVCELTRDGTEASAAATKALETLLARVGGRAGLIVMDRAGKPGWGHNTQTMTRAYVALDGTEVSGS